MTPPREVAPFDVPMDTVLKECTGDAASANDLADFVWSMAYPLAAPSAPPLDAVEDKTAQERKYSSSLCLCL